MPTFDEIRQLSQLLSRNKLKHIQVLGQNPDTPSKFDQFYEGLVDGTFEKEADAFFHFFPEEKASSSFNVLKFRLYHRLLNTLFVIDMNQSGFTDYQKAYHNCYRNVAACRMLMGRGMRQAAIPLAERTLRKSVQYEFTDIILMLAKDLRMHYGNIIGDARKYRSYNQLVKQYLAIQQAELTVEEYYTELAIHFARSRATQIEILDRAKQYALELRVMMDKQISYRFQLMAYLVLIFRFEIANDYPYTLSICQEALAYFESKNELASSNTIVNFRLKMAAALLQMKNFNKVEENLDICLNLSVEGSASWYLALYYFMIAAFRTENFQKAYDIYFQATNHPNFRRQYQNTSENWYIYEAFIHYFIAIGKVESRPDQPLKNFRLNKFINEVPTYSKDKRGTNITILILQVLFLLKQKKYNAIIDRMEALKTYSHRYLRKNDTFRSNCFINMLLQLPPADFNPIALKRKAGKYWEKLRSMPLETAKQSVEIELVPYEKLWEYVLEAVDKP